MVKIRVSFQFFINFHWLGHIFRVWVAEEVSIRGVAVPIGASLKLVRDVSVVILFRCLLHKLVSICTFAPEWIWSSQMLVSRFHILILTTITWESSCI